MKFSLFGIPVHVQPMFWLVAVLLGAPDSTAPSALAGMISWIVVLFVSILAHELGHAFAMRAYGRNPRIELWGMGGLTYWGEGPNVSHGKNIVVSLAGPFAGIVLGIVVFVIARAVPPPKASLGAELVRQALWVNIGWGIANLAPILPLDGGHVLESTLGWIGGPKGQRVAYGISLALSVSLVAFALYSRWLWIAFLGVWCVAASWRKWSYKGKDPNTQGLPEWLEVGVSEAWRLLFAGRADDAKKLTRALLDKLPAGSENDPARAAVLEALAWANIETGEEREASEIARGIPGGASELLLARLMVSEGRVTEGITKLESVFEQGRASFPALVLSSVYIDQDRFGMVLRLLESERGKRLSAGTHLTLSAQLFHAGKYEVSLEACRLGFERFNAGVFAYNAACAAAQLGRVDDGIQWLERAVAAGFDEAASLDEDADLAPLRADPRFGTIRARVGQSA
jgi:Zn-dependent protease